MHAAGKLSDDDMKKLNRFMVDKIGFLLHLFESGHYLGIDDVLEWSMICGQNWDPPNLVREIDNYLKVLEKRVNGEEELK